LDSTNCHLSIGSLAAEEEWQTSKHFLLERMHSERFDGVFAFSLGAAAVSLLLADLHDDGDISCGFVCLFSGFSATACSGQISDPTDTTNLPTALAPGMEVARCRSSEEFSIPSFHCWGLSDTIIPPTMSRQLASRFASPTIVEHEGGHLVPSAARKPLKSFLQEMAAMRKSGSTAKAAGGCA
jgi:hypothetical protein